MNLEEALIYVSISYINVNELTDPFLLYSTLSDLCNKTYKNKEELKMYWKIIQKINLYQLLFDLEREKAKEEIFKMYYLVSLEVGKDDFLKFYNITENSFNMLMHFVKNRKK